MNFLLFVFLFILKVQEIYSFSRFLKQPSDERQSQGELAYFTCIIKRLEEDEYVSWLHNNRIISNNEVIVCKTYDVRYSIDVDIDIGKYNLQIKNIKRIDTGEYVCTVYDANDETVDKSKTANLTVLEIPQQPYPICSPIEINYIVGKNVIVSCISEKTSPPADLRWKYNNVGIGSSLVEETSSGNYKLSYSFLAKQSNNRATFVCELTTSANPSIRRNCSSGPINVLYPPIVDIQQTGDIILGNEAIFICYSDANPQETKFEWSFDPPIDENMYLLENERILRITRTVNSLNGIQIICRVTNSIGSESKILIIEVKTRESVTEKLNKDSEDDKEEDNTDKSDNNIVNSNRKFLQTSSPTINNNNSDISISLVVIIAVVCIVVILGLALIPVGCMRYTQRQPSDTISRGRPVSIPDVYFEPRDHIDPMLPQLGLAAPWMRTVGVQVPGECEYDVTYNTQVMPQLRQVYYSQRMYPAASL